MTTQREMNGNRLLINDYSADEVREAFIAVYGSEKPTEQIIGIAEAVFDLLNENEEELPEHLKKGLFHLEQSFRVFMALAVEHPRIFKPVVKEVITDEEIDFSDNQTTKENNGKDYHSD